MVNGDVVMRESGEGERERDGEKKAAGKEGIKTYYIQKIEEYTALLKKKKEDLRRLEAQRNELNTKVRFLREELQLLQEPGTIVKIMLMRECWWIFKFLKLILSLFL
jgi:predicted RNase H-like nuclease (RuvC/YqgF family)